MVRAPKLPFLALAVLAAAAPCRAVPRPRIPPRTEIFSLLDSGDFGSLEKIATGLREARVGFYNGWPPIYGFYDRLAFATPDGTVWQKYIGLLAKWQAAYPESPTPRIALANLYRDYAWQARGTGYSDTVTAGGWSLFEERLGMAQKILNEATALKTQDAEAYYSLIIVAKGLGLQRGQMEEAFNRGLAVDPDFTPIYGAKAEYLLPRWRGADGDWQAFATEAADKRKGDDGDILYMYIVRGEAYTGGSDLFADTRISYERMKRGFLVSRRRYPNNRHDLNSFCYFASLAKDTKTAARLFALIGEGYDPQVWANAAEYNRWRDSANAGDIAAILHLNEGGVIALKVAAGALLVMLIGIVAYLVKPRGMPPLPPTLR